MINFKWRHILNHSQFDVCRRQHIWSRASIARLRLCTKKYWPEHTRRNSAKLPVCAAAYIYVLCVCCLYSFLISLSPIFPYFLPLWPWFCLQLPLSNVVIILETRLSIFSQNVPSTTCIGYCIIIFYWRLKYCTDFILAKHLVNVNMYMKIALHWKFLIYLGHWKSSLMFWSSITYPSCWMQLS